MKFQAPKETEFLIWTKHAIEKMKFYGLSEQRIKRILRNPDRIEEGIAPETIALMQKTGSKKHPSEIWLMYAPINKDTANKSKKIIISCWRYPGISKKGEEIPIPEELELDIKKEIEKIRLD
ncbi:MAG TPA: DUF4258 domain-containing protein [Candidatus Pacearchaeota archaeon]|nr:DUF4258 domain-containing protein [Candidatus Pacearchaeota archaeon]HOK94023.1 DUF4258 domain-containing protein [Candidatus Pacearchaeota archaeon]HPO75094.1 DUF4258 domain-containing protein [Candidatus Pacearchaeota archaeon]